MNEDFEPLVKFEFEHGVGYIQFNRPDTFNSLTLDIARAFCDICLALAEIPDLRVVVISGVGDAFMAGIDLAWLDGYLPAGAESIMSEVLTEFHAAVRSLRELPIPVIAAVQGAVGGSGFGLTMVCDLVIASDDAKFCLTYAKIAGCLDSGSSWSLLRIVGARKAMELALLGPTIGAKEALRLGIITKVVPRDELYDEVCRLAYMLALGPTNAYGCIKWQFQAPSVTEFAAQLDAEKAIVSMCAGTADFTEGVKAFNEKRQPIFIGK